MRELKETPQKIWISGKLNAASRNVRNCKVSWRFHVAATLTVKQDVDTNILMVMDPSLCNEPVTVSHWQSLMDEDKKATIVTANWEGYAYLATGKASKEEADEAMEIMRLRLDAMWAEDGPAPYPCPSID